VSGDAISWTQGPWRRSLFVGRPDVELKGIVELTDNNPLVCADAFSLPGAAASLALLAVGPLSEAGLLTERPTMLVNIEGTEEEIEPFLASAGWREGLTLASEPADLGGAVATTVICAIRTPDRLEDID